jgi:hypothetical protein
MTLLGQSGNNTFFGTENLEPPRLLEGTAAFALDQTSTIVQNEGPIKLLHLPPGWRETNAFSGDDGKWTLKSFSMAAGDDVELRMYCRGNEHTTVNLLTFETVLAQPFDGEFRRVSGEEIALLQEIMGPLIGNNQYTNHNPFQSRCSPDCHLASVVVESPGGRPVLTVDGIFIEKNGKAGLRFRDIFITQAVHSHMIFEMLLQAPLREFDSFAEPLHAAMRQIHWL